MSGASFDVKPSTDTAIDDLRDLSQHPGFRRLVAHAGKLWGPKSRDEQVRAAMKDDGNIEDVRRIYAVSAAVEELLCWPETEARRLAVDEVRAEDRAVQVGRRV